MIDVSNDRDITFGEGRSLIDLEVSFLHWVNDK
jgi:hypothetical protein